MSCHDYCLTKHHGAFASLKAKKLHYLDTNALVSWWLDSHVRRLEMYKIDKLAKGIMMLWAEDDCFLKPVKSPYLN